MTLTNAPILTANPKANYLAHKDEIDQAVQRVLESGWYVLGEEVTAFEKAFASWLGTTYAVGVANGTDALEISLRACGIGPDDIVLTVSNTAVATVSAIERCGAFPVFVDIDLETFTMDPACLEETLRDLTDDANRNGRYFPKAIIPVHLYGHPVDLAGILKIAKAYKLYVIEDCAQAHGAAINGQKVGTFGDVAAFSLYPTKNLGALGDGGIIATNDSAIAERINLLRQYGWKERYISLIPGVNSRLDPLQAAVLKVKLQYLDEENEKRQKLAAIYSATLAGSGIALPKVREGCTHVYHQYTIRTQKRDDLLKHLRDCGIITQVLYPVPIHLQPAYKERVPMISQLTQTEGVSQEILSLPIYPELAEETVQEIAKTIAEWTA